MHVVAATPLYPPHSRVGAWLSTHECLAELVRQGHTVEVLTALAAQEYELDGVHVAGRAKPAHRVRHADVVISHLGDRGEAARAAAAADVPSVRMVHGDASDTTQALNAHPTALAVFNARHLADRWDGPSVVVHPPVNPDDYRTTPGGCITLVNLSPAKGGDLFALIAAAMPDRAFLGVRGGYGPQRTRTANNVEVLPVTQDMRDVYSRTRIVVMPSEKESWGRVAVEAMCSGIPVVASPTPGLRECLGDAGIFVDRSDLTGWVNELRRLEDPSEWAAASAAALVRSSQFDHRADLARFVTAVEALVKVTA